MSEPIKDDKKDAIEYRDDPSQFAQSADSVQRGSSSTSTGGGVEDAATPTTGMSRGSQEDWRGKPDGSTSTANDQQPKSRSDDPGQSSYGGFKDEGPADDKNHAPDAGGGTGVGGMATSSSNLGSSLSDDEDEREGGTSKVAPNNPQSPDDRER